MLVANAHRPDESKNEPQCHKDHIRDSRISLQPYPKGLPSSMSRSPLDSGLAVLYSPLG